MNTRDDDDVDGVLTLRRAARARLSRGGDIMCAAVLLCEYCVVRPETGRLALRSSPRVGVFFIVRVGCADMFADEYRKYPVLVNDVFQLV